MRSLAEYIMRGRTEAALIAGSCTASLLFAWVGIAAVALVVLRLGFSAASTVILASLVPATAWALFAGEIGPIATLCCIIVLALVLRTTASWSWLLTVMPLVIGGWCLGLLLLAPDYVAQLVQQLEQITAQFMQQLNEQRAAAEQEPLPLREAPSGQQLVGFFGLMQSVVCAVILLVARWWQSVLYNPGGFRDEFHALRLEKLQVVALVLGLVLLSSSTEYQMWSWLFALPLVVAGIALVHGLFGIHAIPRQWLVVFYLALVIANPMLPFLLMLAVADTALDFRQR